MRADDEIRDYLQSLLEHEADCQTEHCPLCAALEGVLDLVRRRIFSGPVFPEVMISTRDVEGTLPAAPPTPKKRRALSPSMLYKLPL
jgi:hypothetical protein